MGICRERSSNTTWRNRFNCWRGWRGGASSDRDRQLEAGPRYWRGHHTRSDSRYRVGHRYQGRRSSREVLELTAERGVDAVFDTLGGLMFEPALRLLRRGGRHVAISSRGEPRVSFNLIDFYHNSSRLLGVDSYALTARQVGEIAAELRRGFETAALKPPAIEIVPFEKAVDAYSRMTAGVAKAKQVLGFRFEKSTEGTSDRGKGD
jgi:D-arabinose 1-dehydrogenase-like Zn-dependent alcohol dehydrogenase